MDDLPATVTTRGTQVALARSFSVARVLAKFAQQMGCEFLVDGKPTSAIEVMSEQAFLPVIALHADLEFLSLLGEQPEVARAGAGVSFSVDGEALFGTSVQVRPLSADEANSLRMLVFLHAAQLVFGLEPNARIECRPIYELYQQGLLARALRSQDEMQERH